MSAPDKFMADKGIVDFPARRADMVDTESARSNISVMTSAEFVGGFVSPDYHWDGIIQRRFLYSLCGKTGSGKTAVALRLLASTGVGSAIGARDIAAGNCLMLVGENPDDVRARWIALGEAMDFDDTKIPVHFIPGIYPIPELVAVAQREASRMGDLALVVVDTSAAYFDGDDENSNTAAGNHARRLRALTDLPGHPAVIINCHPPKNASDENLLPRGGGAFLAEVDGNLSCKSADGVCEVHWQGKFRGPDFQPVPFELVTVTSSRLVDSRGRPMPTVIARPITDFEQMGKESGKLREMRQLLGAIADNPGRSVAGLCADLGWVSKTGVPNKAKVHRLTKDLLKDKLIVKALDALTITPAGAKAAKRGEK